MTYASSTDLVRNNHKGDGGDALGPNILMRIFFVRDGHTQVSHMFRVSLCVLEDAGQMLLGGEVYTFSLNQGRHFGIFHGGCKNDSKIQTG